MKLPKFMSRGGPGGDAKSGSGRQLLITDLQFQPHKNAAAIMNFDKSLYMTPKRLNFNAYTPVVSATTTPASGRYAKSIQPKRLQRTPKCYVGTVNKANVTPIRASISTIRPSVLKNIVN